MLICMEANSKKEVNTMTAIRLLIPDAIDSKINEFAKKNSKPGFTFNRTQFILNAIEQFIDSEKQDKTAGYKKSA